MAAMKEPVQDPLPDLGAEHDFLVPYWLFAKDPVAVDQAARKEAKRKGLELVGEPRRFVVSVWDVARAPKSPTPRRQRAKQAVRRARPYSLHRTTSPA